MPSVEELLAQLRQANQTIAQLSQTVAVLTAMLAGDGGDEPTEIPGSLSRRG